MVSCYGCKKEFTKNDTIFVCKICKSTMCEKCKHAVENNVYKYDEYVNKKVAEAL